MASVLRAMALHRCNCNSSSTPCGGGGGDGGGRRRQARCSSCHRFRALSVPPARALTRALSSSSPARQPPHWDPGLASHADARAVLAVFTWRRRCLTRLHIFARRVLLVTAVPYSMAWTDAALGRRSPGYNNNSVHVQLRVNPQAQLDERKSAVSEAK